MLLKQLMEKLIGSTVLVQHEDRVFQKLGKCKFTPFQFAERFASYKYIVEFFDPDHGYIAAEITVGMVYHNQINLAIAKKLGAFDRSLIDDFDMCVGKFLVETFQVWNQKIAAYSIACTNSDLSSGRSSIQQLGFAFPDQIHGWFDVAHENLPFRS